MNHYRGINFGTPIFDELQTTATKDFCSHGETLTIEKLKEIQDNFLKNQRKEIIYMSNDFLPSNVAAIMLVRKEDMPNE